MIIKKLCLGNKGDLISDEALEAYANLFDKPLLDCHVKAILALFGWDAPILPLQGDEDVVVGGQ